MLTPAVPKIVDTEAVYGCPIYNVVAGIVS
jgi:hypothetical protein